MHCHGFYSKPTSNPCVTLQVECVRSGSPVRYQAIHDETSTLAIGTQFQRFSTTWWQPTSSQHRGQSFESLRTTATATFAAAEPKSTTRRHPTLSSTSTGDVTQSLSSLSHSARRGVRTRAEAAVVVSLGGALGVAVLHRLAGSVVLAARRAGLQIARHDTRVRERKPSAVLAAVHGHTATT